MSISLKPKMAPTIQTIQETRRISYDPQTSGSYAELGPYNLDCVSHMVQSCNIMLSNDEAPL